MSVWIHRAVNISNVPVINLSSKELTDKELMHLSYGLEYNFVDKNKYVKKNVAASLESLAQLTNDHISNERKKEYHEFLRAYCDIFIKNIYNSKDFAYCNLKRLIKKESIVVILGVKDSCVVIIDKIDHV